MAFYLGSREATPVSDPGKFKKRLAMLAVNPEQGLLVHYATLPEPAQAAELGDATAAVLNVGHGVGLSDSRPSYGLEGALALFALQHIGAKKEAAAARVKMKKKLAATAEIVYEEIELGADGKPVHDYPKSGVPVLETKK